MFVQQPETIVELSLRGNSIKCPIHAPLFLKTDMKSYIDRCFFLTPQFAEAVAERKDAFAIQDYVHFASGVRLGSR